MGLRPGLLRLPGDVPLVGGVMIEPRAGEPPHPAPDDSLAEAIEGSRQTVLEVIEEAPDVNAVNSVAIRLTEIEAIFEWYVATLRAAAEAKRLELGGAPKPQG